MAIRLITGRNNRGVDTCKNNKFTDGTPCRIHTNDTCHYRWQKAQTATLHNASTPLLLRPVMREMAMLGPPLHDSLYSMAWTVFAGWR